MGLKMYKYNGEVHASFNKEYLCRKLFKHVSAKLKARLHKIKWDPKLYKNETEASRLYRLGK